jgi:hypothetical protein
MLFGISLLTDAKQEYSNMPIPKNTVQMIYKLANLFIFMYRVLDDIIRVMTYPCFLYPNEHEGKGSASNI